MHKNSLLDKLALTLLPLLIVVSPLLFWTLTPNFFATPKQLFLITITLISLIIWALSLLKHRSLTFASSPLTTPLLVFVTAIILNLALIREGRTEALVGRGSLYLAGSILAFLSTIASSTSLKKRVLTSIILTTSLLSFHTILQLTFLYSLDFLPTFMQVRSFTPAGTPLATLTLIIIGLTTSITWSLSTKDSSRRTLLLIATAIQTIALVAYLSLILPGKDIALNILPLRASWSVALDAMKTTRTIIFGIGLSNFSALFTTVKPLYLNATQFWNSIPVNSGSELLQLLTTGGLLLVTPLIFVMGLIPRALKTCHTNPSDEGNALAAVTLAALIAFIFTPASVTLVIILFIALGLFIPSTTKTTSFSPLLSTISFTLILVFVGLSLFFSGRLTLAENHLRRAQIALATSDGQTVYQEHLEALKLIPSLTNYHLSYSQINLSLAAALSQKADLTEEDRNRVTQLISQAIRSGRLATSLRPNLSTTWNNLGNIYRNLINVADGSHTFAIEYLSQGIALDPGNPSLRFDLGGLFFQLANNTSDQATKNAYYSRAIEEFNIAIQLKRDYANAWYNLARTLEEVGNIPSAYQAMQQVVANLGPDSPDLPTATAELETLKAKLPTNSPTPATSPSPTTSSLTEPSPLPSPLPGGPLDLPAESPLPSPSLTPEPIPSPTTTPTPIASPTPEL